VLGSTVFFRKL